MSLNFTPVERAEGSATRRSVVKAGLKLAYGAPLVAASFKLTGSGALADEGVCSCVDDKYSPKQLDGACYSCKVPEAGCVATQSNVQAVDLMPGIDTGNDNDLVCVCQGTTCIINGDEYSKGDNVTFEDPGCRPYRINCGGPVSR